MDDGGKTLVSKVVKSCVVYDVDRVNVIKHNRRSWSETANKHYPLNVCRTGTWSHQQCCGVPGDNDAVYTRYTRFKRVFNSRLLQPVTASEPPTDKVSPARPLSQSCGVRYTMFFLCLLDLELVTSRAESLNMFSDKSKYHTSNQLAINFLNKTGGFSFYHPYYS